MRERAKRERKKENPSLLSTIHGVSLIRIRRANNQSFLPRRGLRVGTIKEGFHQRSKGGDLGEIKVFGFRRCSRDLLLFYYTPRGRDSS